MRTLGLFQYSTHVLAVFFLYLTSITTSKASYISGYERDRLALLAFKANIVHDPQGVFSSWNSSLHFCNWGGIICSRRHRRVTTLDLSSKGLVGSLSPDVGNLSFVRQIILYNNSIQGRIPQELGRLFRLKVLSLAYNNLDGEIPKNISMCSKLIQLLLDNNELTGKIPNELGSLSKLQKLVLDVNNFIGDIPPSIGNLTSLQVLSASQNALSGYLYFDFGSLVNLQELHLTGNKLGSGVQGDFGFIDSLANCSVLRTLELGSNNFGGSLPYSITNLSTEITRLDLARNKISGSIPSEIGKFINLIYLALNGNELTGIIPPEIVKLRKLQRVVLSNNRLEGKIPASIGNLSIVDQLQFDNNKLDGTIPSSFGNCPMLVLLDLSRNNLSGTIPVDLFGSSPFSIELNLSRNHLVGSLPAELGSLITLGALDVSENELSGVIPSELVGCTGLEKLYIQGNFIQSPVPNVLTHLRGMQSADLSRNNFSGEIPKFLETLSLNYLNLSWNDFDGEIPVKGVFANPTAFSIVGNKRLCGGLPELQLPRCNTNRSHKYKFSRVQIIIFIVTTVFVWTMICSSYYFFLGGSKKENFEQFLPSSFFKVSYWSLFKATNGFSIDNLVGVGSSGSVYKGNLGESFGRYHTGHSGILDRDGTVAVKVFSSLYRSASDRVIAECEAIRDIRHRNLVKIITTCSGLDKDGHDFTAIIYQFMENGSLERWLHSTQQTYLHGLQRPQILNLQTRVNIAIDVARAIDYLHHQHRNTIIHCDLKPSNILLDSYMVAHLTNFGLAKFLHESPRSSDQRNSDKLRGTIGYIAPEYVLGSKVSKKGDVYSYGILLLEILTGKKPTDPMFHGGFGLHDFVLNALPERVMSITDPVILTAIIGEDTVNTTNIYMTSIDEEDVNQIKECLTMVLIIGVKCTMESPQVRPDIADVLSALESIVVIFEDRRRFVETDLIRTLTAEFKPQIKRTFFKRAKGNLGLTSTPSSFNLTYEDLHKATNGFSLTNSVGTGGFGTVYKGVFNHFDLQFNGTRHEDGIHVAVKVFNLQRRGAVKSFIAECKALRDIHCKNLVKILTTCTSLDEDGHEFRAIVYEFMENGSVDSWLHPSKKKYHRQPNKPRILNLRNRINIAVDVAQALDYLHHQHENPIIHCDIKPDNILLDREMVACVADFGLATSLPEYPNSDRSTTIGLRGTTGYIAPEYGLGNLPSTKGDVYSFGILLLEMLTGKNPTHAMFHRGLNLHYFAGMALPDRVMDIIDPAMKETGYATEEKGTELKECMTTLFNLGVKCSTASPQARPDISDVVGELKSVRNNFKEMQRYSASTSKN